MLQDELLLEETFLPKHQQLPNLNFHLSNVGYVFLQELTINLLKYHMTIFY